MVSISPTFIPSAPLQRRRLHIAPWSSRRSPLRPAVAIIVPTASAAPASDIVSQSLNLLEWPSLTSRVLAHASTPLAASVLLSDSDPAQLYLPTTREESELLLRLTRQLRLLLKLLPKDLPFGDAHDVIPFIEGVRKQRVLPSPDLLAIARTLSVAHALRRDILRVEADAVPDLYALVDPLNTAQSVQRELLRCLEEDGSVSDNAHPELADVRDEMRNVSAQANSTLSSMMSANSDAIQDRLITSRYDRLVIPVKTTHKSRFRRGIVHDTSASGSTSFMEPLQVRPLNDKRRALAAKERKVVNMVLKKLSLEVVLPVADDIVQICKVIGTIDAAGARASVADSLQAVDVVFSEDESLYLPKARHPLLMWAATDKARRDGTEAGSEPAWKEAVVPTTYELPDGVRCVCITGPNTGGKTLAMKTLGMCALMARAGLFVPAQLGMQTGELIEKKAREVEELHVRLPFFDAVLADIGDDQSLVQSLSTFSGHVRRIKLILAACTPQSLVLLDEIGSGTDPAEGAALGMATLRYLAVGKRAGLTFATTHHGELKTMKYATDGTGRLFENASVEFDEERMGPTFRLVWGVPGRSNAVAIAERLGLEGAVVEEARRLMGSGGASVEVEEVVRRLQEEKVRAERAREEAERLHEEVRGMREETRGRLEKLQASERRLREDQRRVMDEEVRKARKEIGKVIRDMQQGGGSGQQAGRATERLRGIEARGVGTADEAAAVESGQVDGQVDVGDRVEVGGLSEGLVEVVEKVSGREVVVAMGSMRVKVKLRDVSRVHKREKTEKTEKKRRVGDNNSMNKSKKKGKPPMIRTAANSVDVRGERVEQAKTRVEQAVDRAAALGVVWIVHGHGTGRLRTGVRDALRQHDLVTKVEDAAPEDGGSAVTVAHL